MTSYPWMQLPTIRVATHGCPQHLDELVAVSLLKLWAAARKQTVEVNFLARSAITTAADQFDVLVDIGQEWNPSTGRFDHHQGDPEVAGRSSAGLVFEALFANDTRREFLEPIIRHVDEIDTGTSQHHAPDAANRGARLTSLTAVLKAVGGFQHNPTASQRCLEIVEALVQTWLEQAASFAHAPQLIATSEQIGGALLLDSDEHYGPGLLEYLATTNITRVGFPSGPNRYQVVALRDATGELVAPFNPLEFPTACFVHPQGFLVVFADRDQAVAAISGLGI